MSDRLSWSLRWRLSVLWALEWGITGAVLTYLPVYFQQYDIKGIELGQLMAVSAVGLWVAPFVVGQICDRWMATEKYLAVAHSVGGLTLIAIPVATEYHQANGDGFGALLFLVGLYAVAYFPTIPLASSLSFRHLPDPDSQFGKVRVWGTVGWVFSGLALSVWLRRNEAYQYLINKFPSSEEMLARWAAGVPHLPEPVSADSFRLAALLSYLLVTFCVFLPHTPPEHAARGSVAPLETLRMFKDRTFALLIAISFLLALAIPFYAFAVPKLVAKLLAGHGLSSGWVPAVMTVGQISEFPALLFLAFCLKRFGLKTTFAMGMAAWIIRYGLFAFQDTVGLVLAGIALHGICHVFLVIVIQLYVDAQCRRDLRASAQNLFAFITMGIAMPVGFLLAGVLGQWFRIDSVESANYAAFFTVPAVFVLALLILYWKWFEFRGAARRPT